MASNNAVQEWKDPDGLLLLESWAREGMTLEQIAARVGVHKAVLIKWSNTYEEVKKAINNGRELVDYKVENALLKSALGYKTREVKIVTTIKNGTIIEERKEVTDKEFAPNVGAIQTWLYNRRPDKWKSMNAKSSILDNIDEDTNITIKVERASSPELDNCTTGTNISSNMFEETDTDWERDVNKEVTVRGLSEKEKKEKKSQKLGIKNRKAKNVESLDLSDENEALDSDNSDWGNDIYEG